MLRSMYAATSGLKNHQIKMDVISNNISNVNTAGFKKGSVTFTDMMYQQTKTSSAPSENYAGTNSHNIGLGSKVSAINTTFTQGPLLTTGRPSDLALQGEGFFVVSNGESIYYTRNGNFGLDKDGYVCTSDGYRVLGKTTGGNGQLEPIRVPLGETLAPTATNLVSLGNNLKSTTDVDGVHNTSIEVFDNLGGSHIIKTQFIKSANPNEWQVEMSLDPASPIVKDWLNQNVPNYDTLGDKEKAVALENANDALLTGRKGTIAFGQDGLLDTTATQAANGTTGDILLPTLSFTPPGTQAMSIDFDISKMTQYDSKATATATNQNGNPAGQIQSIAFDSKGNVHGVFSGGQTKVIATLSIATFVNQEGLDPAGNSLFQKSPNSGEPVYGIAGEDGSALISSGYLESSNVDLSSEVTDMIVCQRGFSMNAKMITVSDEMLQELTNMKR